MQVKVARIYLGEDEPLLKEIYSYLHQEKMQGATLFKGVQGFGHTGKDRSASIMDIHFNLPVVLEFFDEPDRVDAVLNHFAAQLSFGHVLCWFADIFVAS